MAWSCDSLNKWTLEDRGHGYQIPLEVTCIVEIEAFLARAEDLCGLYLVNHLVISLVFCTGLRRKATVCLTLFLFQRTTILLASDPSPRLLIHSVLLGIVNLEVMKTLSNNDETMQRLPKDLGRLLGELLESAADYTLIIVVAANSGEGDGEGGMWRQDLLVSEGLDLEEL